MSGLRTLAGVAQAARRQGLEVIATFVPGEVVFECPICKAIRFKSLASVELLGGAPSVRCKGCEQWGDDPYEILRVLAPGYDPDDGDPFEIPLRVFGLLWSLQRWEVAA